MKKILFLLLLTVASYGQVSTGQETEFDYGIKNNSTQTITTPTYLTTTGTDGTQGKIPSAYIAKTADVAVSLATKENVANKSDSYTTSSSTTYASTKALVDGLALQIPLTQKGAINGVATLGADGKVPNSQIPALAISETFPVASQAEMLALSSAEQGDVAIRSDISKSYILRVSPSSVLSNWSELLSPTDAVTSVNGQTGVVNLTKSDVGLGNVDNTSDLNKPISTATQTALNLKEPIIPTGTALQYIKGDKTLGTFPTIPTVDQTIIDGSTNAVSGNAVFDGLALKANLASPTFTGTVSGITKTMVGLENVDNTSDANKPISTATQTALDSKAPISGSANYIQNQNASAQSANMWISGDFKLNGSISSPDNGIQYGQKAFKIEGVSDTSISVYGSKLSLKPFSYNGISIDYREALSLNSDLSATFASTVTASNGTLIGGTLTSGYIPKATGVNNLENSLIFDNGTNVGIGTTSPSEKLEINGAAKITRDGYQLSLTGSDQGAIDLYKSGTLGHRLFSDMNSFGIYDLEANVTLFSISKSTGAATFASTVTATSFIKSGGTSSQFLKADGSVDSSVYASTASPSLTGTPTAPTAAPGTNTTQIATTAFVQANGGRPYKVYTALLTQTGTSAPVATVLENTLGGTVSWGYISVGTYSATLTGSFIVNKTVTFVNQGATSPMAYIKFNRQDTNSCTLRTFQVNTTTSTDAVMANDVTMVEIRVYN